MRSSGFNIEQLLLVPLLMTVLWSVQTILVVVGFGSRYIIIVLVRYLLVVLVVVDYTCK